ncbi:AP2-EREBP transcription factor [Panicum miliaceum]|uniref:AP2-EREBP transcription factor n=1 Tax=Panicum miliaceum TaxID=4540 RepID=A0A3L6PGM8_PANMI|nr:AP2-EREBP transcription factor [Panicum miliaceum]
MKSGGVIELTRQAAAAARDERRARAAALLPARRYRGVQRRGNRYVAIVWNSARKQSMWLGSYATPLEAAYAYDAAARRVHGLWARPNFPDPAARRPARATALATAVGALEDLVRAGRPQEPAARQQQPPPRAQVPFSHWAAPALAAAAQPQRQQRAPPAAFAYQRAATPYSPYSYRPGSSPAAAIYAAAYGAAYFEMTLLPGAYVAPELNRPASSALSSAGPVGASLSLSAAAPERLIEPDQAVVGDNFTDDGASSSAARAFFW